LVQQEEYQKVCTSHYSCLYNQNLLRRAITALGKSLLIVTGVGYGMVKAWDLLAEESRQDLPDPSPDTGPAAASAAPTPIAPVYAPGATLQRLEGMEERLIRMEKDLEVLVSPTMVSPFQPVSPFVTRAEQNAALEQLAEQLASRLQADIERRFEVQNRSVQSLRTMVARTDELLEQVIENIESTSLTA
jgi:hypothetical protein